MPTAPVTNIQLAWHQFMTERELACNYHMPYVLSGMGTVFRNPLLEYLLPSLLYLKMVAILDEALKELIELKGLPVPKKNKNSLHGRIEYLNDQGSLSHYAALHSVRDIRNDLAHESDSRIEWRQLDADLATIEGELQHLAIVGPRCKYEYFGERSAMKGSTSPGVICEREYLFGVKCDGKKAVSFGFTERMMKDSD